MSYAQILSRIFNNSSTYGIEILTILASISLCIVHTRTHIYMYIHICIYWYIYIAFYPVPVSQLLKRSRFILF
jgi:hypothetical protein